MRRTPEPPSYSAALTDAVKRIRELERQRGTASRVVFGSVLNDGVVVDPGTDDWTVEWSDSGPSAPGYPALNIYTITVTPAFGAAINNVNVTPALNGGGDDPYLAITDPSSADVDKFVVMTFNFIGDAADSAFAFAAFEDPA